MTKQERWLHDRLPEGAKRHPRIVAGHFPIFRSVQLYYSCDTSLYYNEYTGYQGNLFPLLARSQVDLYLCGHHHAYERAEHLGVAQVATGADSLGWYRVLDKPSSFTRRIDPRGGFTEFVFDASTDIIRGTAFDLNGENLDTWEKPVRR